MWSRTVARSLALRQPVRSACRFQSTVQQPAGAVQAELAPEMLNSPTLDSESFASELENLENDALDMAPVEFKVFPSMQTIEPELLMGHPSYNSKSYYIWRSATGNLPVYLDYLRGKKVVVTEIRKIQGNVVQLRNDLQEQLPGIAKSLWTIKPQSKKIIIRGNVLNQVKEVLEKNF